MIIFRLLPGELLSGEAGRDAAHGVQQLIAGLVTGGDLIAQLRGKKRG